MGFETIRINELAKELKLTSKEVIEKLAQISITGKLIPARLPLIR